MGLDMYIYKTTRDRIVLDDNLLITSFNRYNNEISDSIKAELENEDLDEDDLDEFESSSAYEEFFYWRKHPAIHDWMENLYIDRGGKESFNGVYLYLSKEDLKRLKRDVIKKKLNYDASGFFFGKSENPNSQRGLFRLKEDIKMISLALKEITENPEIVFIYDSSW